MAHAIPHGIEAGGKGILGVTFLALLVALAAAPTSSAHVEVLARVEGSGRTYVATATVSSLEIDDYGALMVYMGPGEVYAYGVAVLKWPGEGPRVYVMAGSQNSWYYLGDLPQLPARLLVALDTRRAEVAVSFGGLAGTFRADFVEAPVALYVAATNVTGRSSALPRVELSGARAFATNASLDEVLASASSVLATSSWMPGAQPTVASSSPGAAPTASPAPPPPIVVLAVAALAISLALALALLRRLKGAEQH
ncbi:MAG: hypothetical protein ABWK00_01745 [Desulfurococcaceae archaeon]